MTVNNKLKRMGKDAVVVHFKNYPVIYLKGLSKITKKLNQNSRSLYRDSKIRSS